MHQTKEQAFNFTTPIKSLAKHVIPENAKAKDIRSTYKPEEKQAEKEMFEFLRANYDAILHPNVMANRLGKSSVAALELVQKWMQMFPGGTILKLDIKSYFDSIHKPTLVKLVRSKLNDKIAAPADNQYISSKNLVESLVSFIGVGGRDDERGIDSGTRTSAFLANFYLADLDYFITKTCGQKHYVRWVDDILIVCSSLNVAKRVKSKITKFLRDELLLELSKEKEHIGDVINGVTFLGTVIELYKMHLPAEKRAELRRKIEKILEGANRANAEDRLRSIVSHKGKLKRLEEMELKAELSTAAEKLRILKGTVVDEVAEADWGTESQEESVMVDKTTDGAGRENEKNPADKPPHPENRPENNSYPENPPQKSQVEPDFQDSYLDIDTALLSEFLSIIPSQNLALLAGLCGVVGVVGKAELDRRKQSGNVTT